MKNKAVFLMGPTAVGKTEIALRIAEYYPLEIINVDSALIYQDLDIGSAKPNTDELAMVPHHLIDILSPLNNYSVADFLKDCNRAICEINQRGKLALLVGGTIMYYNALINGISQLPAANAEIRLKLAIELKQYGNQLMHDKLSQIDPISAAKIAVNDTQRLLRALEVYLLTNLPLSEAQKQNHLPGIINCDYLALAIIPANRNLLHERINLRFKLMVENGFIEEVKNLKLKYPLLTAEHNSMRCVGYRQVWDHLAANLDFNSMLAMGQAATRQLAKRQITWLRGIPSVVLDDANLNPEELLKKTLAQINSFMNTKL